MLLINCLFSRHCNYTYHLRLGAVTCTYRVRTQINNINVHEAIASRYIHACLTINIKLEKMVLLLPVKHKLHARNRVVSTRKPRRRCLLNHLKHHVALWNRLMNITIYRQPCSFVFVQFQTTIFSPFPLPPGQSWQICYYITIILLLVTGPAQIFWGPQTKF